MGLIWMIFGPLIILGAVRVMEWFGDDATSPSQSSGGTATRLNESDSQSDSTTPHFPSRSTLSDSSPSTRASTPERIWDVAGDPDFDDVSGGAWDATDYDGGGWDGGGDPSM